MLLIEVCSKKETGSRTGYVRLPDPGERLTAIVAGLPGGCSHLAPGNASSPVSLLISSVTASIEASCAAVKHNQERKLDLWNSNPSVALWYTQVWRAVRRTLRRKRDKSQPARKMKGRRMSYDGRVFTVQLGSVIRKLPLFEVAPGVKIAIFNMLGDTDVVETAAAMLATRIPTAAEVLVVPEVKAVPLAHALSVASRLPYVVVRKMRKPYMVNCLETEVLSITTGAPQTLFVDGKDVHLVRNKQVILVDDVISTGSTLRGLRQLMALANANVVGEMAVFTEGKPEDWNDVIALGHLPVFTD